MNKIIDIYHGSSEIVRNPEYGKGRMNNDYGRGFYCTQNEELAKEWACNSLDGGFSNHYRLDFSSLNILDLNCGDYSVLNWLSVLVSHRLFRADTPIAGRAKRYLAENFSVSVDAYDVVIGYRADDSYYDFAQTFLNNGITVEQLSRALMLGNLGEQIVIKSEYAFEQLKFVDYSPAERSLYYPLRKARNDAAENGYRYMIEESAEGLYMIDIIREKVKNDDVRIQRMLSVRSNA